MELKNKYFKLADTALKSLFLIPVNMILWD